MKRYKYYLIAKLFLLSMISYAQTIRITYPLNRTVFQQNSAGAANVSIAVQIPMNTIGSFPLSQWGYFIDKLDIKTGQVSSSYFRSKYGIYPVQQTDFSFIQEQENNLPKGWYKLTTGFVTGDSSSLNIMKITSVIFGVGDVYYIAGQSNASGYDEDQYDDNTNFGETFPSVIQHDGVSYRVGTSDKSSDYFSLNILGLPFTESFGKLYNGLSSNSPNRIYPTGRGSWYWAHFAHNMAKSVNEGGKETPVMLFNVATPNTSVEDWASGFNTSLYTQLKRTLQTYGSILGAKAVLWHQGENDTNGLNETNDSDRPNYLATYKNRMSNLISFSRGDLNPNLSWFISKVSYRTGGAAAVKPANSYVSYFNFSCLPSRSDITKKMLSGSLKNAQNDILNSSNRIFMGVEADDIEDCYRSPLQRIHFTGTNNSFATLGDRWFNAVNNNHSNATPVPGSTLLPISVSKVNNNYKLSGPLKSNNSPYVRYFWVKNGDGVYDPSKVLSNAREYIIPNSNNPSAKADFYICYVSDDTDPNTFRLQVSRPFVMYNSEDLTKGIATNQNSLSFSTAAQQQTIGLTSTNLIWDTADIPSWVNLNTSSGGYGSTLISLTAQTNTSTNSRSATIRFKQAGTANGYERTLTVTQAASGATTMPLSILSPTSGSYFVNASADLNTMQIGGVQYFQGLGVHAPNTVTYNLSGQYNTFFGKVGRDDEADNVYDSGKVQFVIKADGVVIWTSQVHGNNTSAEAFNVNVSGKNNLELIVNQLEDMNFDHADWVDLYLTTSGGGCSTPTNPSNVSASASSITSGQSTTLSASCSVGTITWSTGQTGASVSISPTASTTYQVSCVNGSCQSGTVPVSITVIPSGGGGACSAVSNNLTMGTWTVTGQPLLARYFHGQYWLTQKVSSSPDEFVVRGAAMLQRSDVSLSNSANYNLINCFSWIYSDYGNLQVPNSSTFPTPAGYTLVYSQDGTPYYSASGAPPSGIVSGNCYKIRSLANNNYVQAMSNGEVQINGNNNQNDQKWKVESVGTSYKVTTMNGSGQVIKANSLSYSSGLVLGNFVSGNNYYYWNFENNAGNYRVSAPSNQYTWDHEGAGSGNHLQIYGTTSEQFIDYRLFAFEGTTCPAGLRVAAETGATEEEKTGYMNFAPNPTNGAVEVKVNLVENGEVNVSLTDFMGRELESKNYQGSKGNNSFDFKASNLPAGVYLLRVKSKGKIESKKIVIE